MTAPAEVGRDGVLAIVPFVYKGVAGHYSRVCDHVVWDGVGFHLSAYRDDGLKQAIGAALANEGGAK